MRPGSVSMIRSTTPRDPPDRRAVRTRDPPPGIGQHDLRRVVPGGAHDPAAGVHADPAEVVAVDRRPVGRDRGQRPRVEQLIQVHLPVEDVPAGDQVVALEILGRDDRPVEDVILEVGRVLAELGHDLVTPALLDPVPGLPVRELERELLDAERQRVLALGGQGGIGGRLDHGLDHVALGDLSATLRLPGGLEVLDRGAEHLVAVVLGAVAGVEAEVGGELVDQQVDSGHRAALVDPLDLGDELVVELGRVDEPEQRTLRVGVRDHGRGGNLVAGFEHDPGGRAAVGRGPWQPASSTRISTP